MLKRPLHSGLVQHLVDNRNCKYFASLGISSIQNSSSFLGARKEAKEHAPQKNY
jgi:hypothetical protein